MKNIEPFAKNIAESRSYASLLDAYKVSAEECHPLYPHITMKVENLSQFIEIISVIKSSTREMEGDLIFRGMADHRWELLPSIARQTMIIEPEQQMVKELMLLYPEEFSNIHSNFDLLAKMQHYGLPTRLLDFTTNPLVALFFACHEHELNSTGRVLSTIPCYQPYTDEYIEAVCGLHKLKNYSGYFLEDLIKNSISFANFDFYIEHPLIAKPQYSNDRIKNQSAMFMVFQNELWDYGAMKVYEKFISNNADSENQDFLELEKLDLIYPKVKTNSANVENWFVTSESLTELCGCYESDIDIERKAKYFSMLFDKNSTLFPHRFSLVPQIRKVDEKIMKNSFCSILIDPKHKRKILEELDLININERFLFPELEYTVKYIKEKYWSSYKT